MDYLRLAVPDEIATALSRGPGLAIRPFSTTSRLDIETSDPLTLGRNLGVGNVVAGQYFKEGDRLSLTLEAIDVASNSVVWRDSVVVDSHELLSLRQAVAESVEQGLIPVLDPGAVVASTETLPQNEEAYDLYLRSLPASSDPAPNTEAMEQLERAVMLDPSYSPAWAQLARRYYYNANYADAGEEYYDRAEEAARRALQLDPELMLPQEDLIVIAVERGELAAAYEEAEKWIAQRPKSGRAHFARGYVLRYAGALDQAVQECDRALALEPNNAGFRSCGVTNHMAGRYDRALQFLALDPGSSFADANRAVILMRQGRPEEAVEIFRESNASLSPILEAFVEGRPADPEVVQQVFEFNMGRRDSEQQNWAGNLLAYLGEHQAGLQLIRKGIDSGYCAYPSLETDPLLAGLRSDPELADAWTEAVAAGKACHEEFLAATDQ
jgi:tetratricopeptide (TPR) repeat protein